MKAWTVSLLLHISDYIKWGINREKYLCLAGIICCVHRIVSECQRNVCWDDALVF
jgi:hypothetical protein